MKRATATAAMVVMVLGLLPAAASAGGGKRSKSRARSEVPAVHLGSRGGIEAGAGLRRQTVTQQHAKATAAAEAMALEAAAAAQAPHLQQPSHAVAPAHARHDLQRARLAPAARARSSGLGRKVLAAVGVGVAAFGAGVVIAAGFAAVGAAAPLAAVIGIPSALILTGAVALIGGAMDGPSVYSPYDDPRNVLRAAAFQQQRRRQQQMGNNFPPAGQ